MRTSRTLIGTAAIIAGMLGLAGCASNPQALPEADFLELTGELASYADFPDETLIDLGKGVCEVRAAAENEGTTQLDASLQYLGMATDKGLDAGDVGSFLVYATGTYCPQHLEAGSLDQ